MENRDLLLERLEQLERFTRVTKALVIVGFLALLTLAAFGRYVWAATPNDVLRVRGIVVEDSKGVPRILLGAPAPNYGRQRRDDVVGLILLSSDGTDRLTIGTANYDQVNGRLQHRIANGIGIMLNDAKGNERGGFGVLDSGRASLGIDRANGTEAAFLTVDEDGFTGLLVKDNKTCNVTALGNSPDTGTRLLLRDQNCADRVILGLKSETTPQLEVRDKQEKLLFDAFSKPN